MRDDYWTILHFANALTDRPSLTEKITFFLAEQNNEYKLYVLHAPVWLQTTLTHRINFRILIGLGDAFVLLLGILLWKQFLPAYTDLRRKLIYFVPVLFAACTYVTGFSRIQRTNQILLRGMTSYEHR